MKAVAIKVDAKMEYFIVFLCFKFRENVDYLYIFLSQTCDKHWKLRLILVRAVLQSRTLAIVSIPKSGENYRDIALIPVALKIPIFNG